VRPAPVDLVELTEDVLAKARGLAERDWVLDGAAHDVVALDAQRITQALLQLADNAVKHTGPGDEIGIGSGLVPDGVRLWVRDTGAGIPPEHRDLVFERFGRSAVPTGDEGFGLGLSIVSAIAAAHGGRVGIRDTEPHGAVVEMVLPAVHPAPPTEEDPAWPAS
jgi:signal transduction histidine kinase